MALDGIVLRQITKELQAYLPAKINKIQQLSDTEIILQLHSTKGSIKLLISTHSVYNRIHITQMPYTTLDTPGNFVMVLRKQIDGAWIQSLTQIGLDRILHMEVSARDELGDIHLKHIYIELMGKYANMVLVGEDNRIMDACKRIPPFENNKRTIHPGAIYTLPAAHLHKQDPFHSPQIDPSLSLSKQLHGFSPLLSDEVYYRMDQGQSFASILDEIESSKQLYISELPNTQAFHILPLTHLQAKWHAYTIMEGLDLLFHEKEEQVRIKQQSGDVAKIVRQEYQRSSAKLPKLKSALTQAMDCETYRICGDLLFAYMNSIQRQNSVTLPTFEDGKEITIALDMRYDIKQNANRYYQKYHKAKRAQHFLQEQIRLCEKEIHYFEALKLQLEQANVQDAMEIREELIRLHYMKPGRVSMKRKKKNQPPHYECFVFDEGNIYVGKNNVQNDYVTWKLAHKQDIWLHVKDMHGAHVVIACEHPSEALLRDGAMLAAWYSEARDSSSVAVNYCHIRQLKKIPAHHGSFVSLSNYKTIYMDPDSEHIHDLLEHHLRK